MGRAWHGRGAEGGRVALGTRSCFFGYVLAGIFSKIHLDVHGHHHHHHQYRGALYNKNVWLLAELPCEAFLIIRVCVK